MLTRIIRMLETLLRLLQPASPACHIPPPLSPPAHVTSEPDVRPGLVPERALWRAMYGIDTKPCSNCGMWGMT